MNRPGQVLFAAVISAAVIGFFVGIDDGVPRAEVATATINEPADGSRTVMPATAYSDLRDQRIGANADYRNQVEDLAEPLEPPPEPPPARSKRESLVDRGERRAFNGAPPVIPHLVDSISSDACLGCHEVSAVVDKNRADRMPHPYLTSCQQCHVATESPIAPTMLVVNRFVGVPAPFEGARAWQDAPPTIPHSTLMREDCASCHGLAGKAGLRTSHPERVNCTQCHAPSATLDQLAVAPTGFLAGPAIAR